MRSKHVNIPMANIHGQILYLRSLSLSSDSPMKRFVQYPKIKLKTNLNINPHYVYDQCAYLIVTKFEKGNEYLFPIAKFVLS